MNWSPLTSLDQLDQIDQESKNGPVAIFKHSTRCSISAASLNRMERNWDGTKSGDLKMYFLDLIQYREVSNAIAQRYQVEHQSPQILLIADEKCQYHTSHFSISFDELVKKSKEVNYA